MNLSGKRLLICEEALKDYTGHFYNWVRSIKEINEDAGVTVKIAGNTEMESAIVENLEAYPIYSKCSWDDTYHFPQAWKRYISVFRHNSLVFKETKALLDKSEPFDCLLVPAARIHHLIAWRRLCSRYLGKKFKRLVIFIITSEADYNEDHTEFRFKKSSNLIKLVLRSFRKYINSGEVVLAGDSHITSHEYTTLSGMPFIIFPSPGMALTNYSKDTDLPAKNPNELVFSLLGISVYDKGIDVWQEVVLRYLENHPDNHVRFVIQWAQPTMTPQGTRIQIDERLRKSDRVTLLEHVLSEEEYKNYFQNSDFIVLPYRLKSYFNRTSGVLIEAACLGIPMIVTDNTWLAWAIKEYASGLTAKEADADDLYTKLLNAVENADELQEKAKERQPSALAQHSTQGYLSCLWESRSSETNS